MTTMASISDGRDWVVDWKGIAQSVDGFSRSGKSLVAIRYEDGEEGAIGNFRVSIWHGEWRVTLR